MTHTGEELPSPFSHGCSEGVPSETGFLADADAVVQHVLARKDINTRAVFIYGASIGGAVAVYVGQKYKEVREM